MTPQRELLVNAVHMKILPSLQHLTEVWSDLGLLEDEEDTEATQFTESIEHVLSRMLESKLVEVEARRKELLEEVEMYGLLLIKLSHMLDIPNIEPDETLKVIPLRDYLKARVSELEDIRTERAKKLDEVCTQEKKLTDFLGEIPLKIPLNDLKEKTIEDVRTHVEELQKEKLKRRGSFEKMRNKILLLMDELEHHADTSLEKDIVSVEEDAFFLTEVNMNAANVLLKKFKRNVNLYQIETKTLLDSIEFIWNFLEVEPNYRARFLKEHIGHRPSTIRALRDELKRCKDIKMKNARQYVEKVRLEITNMWNRCYYSRFQQEAFAGYTSVEFTEELVDVHDNELNRLKQVREEGEEIFLKYEKRAELWTRMQQLEMKASDPKRLMNRGGQLLKEEKERKRLQAIIPKLETDLEADVLNWELTRGRQFLVYGKQIMEFIRDQWDGYQREKENEKLARHLAKAKNVEDDYPGSSKSNTSRKRLLATPMKESRNKLAKLTPLVGIERNPLTSSRKVPSRNVTRVTRKQQMKREDTERLRPIRIAAGASNTIFQFQGSRLMPNFSSTSQLSTYSEFENNIKPRSAAGLSSTVTTACSSSP